MISGGFSFPTKFNVYLMFICLEQETSLSEHHAFFVSHEMKYLRK